MNKVLMSGYAVLIMAVYLYAQTTSPIRINQVGYELNGPKTAVYQHTAGTLNLTSFKVINSANSQEVFSGTPVKLDTVSGWNNGGQRWFWLLDFSDVKQEGKFTITCNSKTSFEFEIRKNLYFPKTIAEQLNCYEKMRYSGQEDTSVPLEGSTAKVNIFGGYREASGDDSKHISHLQYSNYMSPQETPMLTWSLLRSYELNKELIDSLSLKTKLFTEAAWGCDYLITAHPANGSFYTTVFNGWGILPRKVTSYEVVNINNDEFKFHKTIQSSFRAGGGIGIAALAVASKLGVSGVNTSADYLSVAKSVYDELKANNNKYSHDGKDNMIDDYCALIAAIELYRTTSDNKYKDDAGARVDKIIGRQHADGYFFSDDDKNRPHYHAAEEGLPLIALMHYREIDKSKDAAIKQTVQKNVNWYFKISHEVTNPFNYARLFCKPCVHDTTGGPNVYKTTRSSFFMPIDSNETGYWYQGENARLGSMATALLNAAKTLKDDYQFGTDSLTRLAVDQINWVLGKNPFEICMLFGFGTVNNEDYIAFRGDRANIKGGICNGITAAENSTKGLGIKWMAVSNSDTSNRWQNWRWLEQWLPHESWYTIATATLSNIIRNSQTGVINNQNSIAAKPVSVLAKSVPSQGSIQITLSRPSEKPMTLRLIDLKGRVIQAVKIAGAVKNLTLDARSLSTGVYFVELQTGEKHSVRAKIECIR